MRGSHWSGVAFVVVAGVGCSAQRTAPVATAAPPIATAAPPALASAPASSHTPSAPRLATIAAPSTPERCELDPLSAENAQCGDPIDNPAALPQLGVRADGSCKTQCQPVQQLPVCKNRVARAVDATTLKATGNVRLRGTLSVPWFQCTKVGGPCACSNRCSGALRLARPGSSLWNAAELGPRAALLGADLQEIQCPGDDASVCCPYGLDRDHRALEVIATGELVPSPDPDEARLVVTELCRVPVPPPPADPAPPWSGGELIDLSEGDRARLRVRATHVWSDLLSALPRPLALEPRLTHDGDPFAVRLASWCSNDYPVVAVSDGFLLLVAYVVEATVYDLVFGKNSVETLSAVMAQRLDRGEGLAGLPPKDLPRTRDPRVLTRQHELFDATLRFLLAHELAHVALGHNPCSAESKAAQGRYRQGCIEPAFSYPLEIAADEYAARLLREQASSEYPLRPQGAIAWFRFLDQWERKGRAGIRTDFQRGSLPAALRAQLVQELSR